MRRPPASRSALASAVAAVLTILAAGACTPPPTASPDTSRTTSLPGVDELLARPTEAPRPSEAPTAPPPAEASEGTAPDAQPGSEAVAGTATLPLPPEAFNPDIAGTLPVVQHFLDAWRLAYLEGDTEPLRDISADDCAYCIEIATLAELYTADGATGSGGDIHATSVRRAGRADTDAQGWRMDLVVDTVAYDSPDGVNMMMAGFSDHVFLGLVWQDERWLVSEVTSSGASGAQQGP
ncbi:hypothetical protein ATL41_1351 [Flavimobilis soli]|uniref:DUF6318 domain-containing protein n=1 Tax=Flavimobilis soli TaxID=442709 RepID=A0A2A9EDI8_9MICO|nr:DUF6318 family protein [Flavimobilis soli]PFG36621.1 hypothetical protein ATL41_1351 [Flavimobilis soli]